MIPSPSTLPESRKIRRIVTTEDLRLYKAITGRPAELHDTQPAAPASASQQQTIGAIAWRVLTPDVAHLTLRLREVCEVGIAHGVRRPQMADWLRRVSDDAFKRLEEAQARLSDSRRHPITRHVDAREVGPLVDSGDNLQSNVA